MLDVNELKLKNIRFYKGRYVVRLMRSYKTLSEAKKFLKQYINCVSIYQTKNGFMVQTYKEYKTLEDAIKVRDYLTEKLEERKSVA
ncbi:hypothetical protein G6Y98_12015 [Clostridium perfringens]|uniref:hypothetical protein n=1 Tax=Clostridium perfringens TaxID=1502 RepID=UPI0013E2E40B|nr:hypothetical protein [Clostridium perfringens]NGT96513.1 hypothetical protein [Clostridium perfringens]